MRYHQRKRPGGTVARERQRRSGVAAGARAMVGVGMLGVGMLGAGIVAFLWPATLVAQCPPAAFSHPPYQCTHATAAGLAPNTMMLAMRWGCMNGAPACDNPGLVNLPTIRFMLWRRHERASDCIWIPASRITMRSGAVGATNNFISIGDPDTSIGGPGDVVVDPPTELFQAWNNLDSAWAGPTKGVLSLSCDRLIDSNGVFVARGIAVRGLVTMPYMAVADPTRICQANERSLAHEVGHVLSLPHVTTAGNLMVTGGSAATDIQLTTAQHNQARSYLQTNIAILDPPLDGPAGFPEKTFDGLEDDLPENLRYMDLINSVILDNGVIDETVTFCTGTNGLIPETDTQGRRRDACFAFALDCDGNAETGLNANAVVPNLNFRGAEFVAMLLVNRETQEVVPILKAAVPQVGFVNIQLEPGVFVGQRLIGDLVVCDPLPTFQGPLTRPAYTEMRATLSTRLFVPILEAAGIGAGEDGRTFPAGLRFQVASAEAEGDPAVDVGASDSEDGGVMLDFALDAFPELFIKRRIAPGQTIRFSVTGLPPNQAVHVLVTAFGETLLPQSQTDDNGNVDIVMDVPEESVLGPTLVSVGVEADSAITADGVVDIVPCPADLDNSGDLTIFDFLRFQNSWEAGEEVGDYDGDSEITIFDFLAYQNDFQQGCR